MQDVIANPLYGSELGGTEITITSDYFSDKNSIIQCCFDGVAVDPLNWNHGQNATCTSPPTRPGTVLFQLVEGLDCSFENENNHKLLYTDSFQFNILASIYSIEPEIGSSNTTVKVLGNGFINSEELLCMFGSFKSKAKFISDQEIHCDAPITNDSLPLQVPLTLSNNGVDVEADWANINFIFAKKPTISSIDPPNAPLNGGTMIFLSGSDFKHGFSTLSFCKIGGSIINATVLSNDEMVCILPTFNRPIQHASVAISLDGGYIYHGAYDLNFIIHETPKIHSIFPSRVPENLRSNVKIYGHSLCRSSRMVCQFGQHYMTAAKWKTDNYLECEVPSDLPIGETLVRVLTNGQSVSATESLPFFVTNAVQINQVQPTVGVAGMESLVSVRGDGFQSNSTMCRFGSVTTFAESFVNSTLVWCKVKVDENSLDKVNVEISSNNGHDWTEGSGVVFKYYSSFEFEELYPKLGPSSGGTHLTLHGTFPNVDTTEICCSFHNKHFQYRTPVLSVEKNRIQCLSPHVEMTRKDRATIFALDITTSAEPYQVMSDKPTSYTVYSNFDVTAMYPTIGSELGGTNVTIYGKFPRMSPKCRFDVSVVESGTWINDRMITCSIPPARSSFLLSPYVDVSISGNGIDFEKISQFKYTMASHIASFTPTRGWANGGSEVSIYGEGFIDGSGGVLCSFGDLLVEAFVESQYLVKCSSPPSNFLGPVKIGLSFDNGNSFISSQDSFVYVEGLAVKSLSPAVLCSKETGEVTIELANMNGVRENDMVHISILDNTLNGIVTKESLIQFTVPIFNRSFTSPIDISINGQDFLTSPLKLTFVQPPSLIEVEPSHLHDDGGTEVRVFGSGFMDLPKLKCRFHFLRSVEIVDAKFVSPYEVICDSKNIAPISLGSASVEILMFGTMSSCNPSSQLKVYPVLSILSAAPNLLPTNSESRVQLKGVGFQSIEQDLYCDFHVLNSQRHFYMLAEILSDDLLECHSPIINSGILDGTLDAQISIVFKQGINYYPTSNQSAHSLRKVIFFSPIILTAASRNTVSMSQKSRLSVFGDNFIESTNLCCSISFENETLSTYAEYISQQQVVCEIPAIMSLSTKNLVLSSLRISNNCLDYSNEIPLHHRLPLRLKEIRPSKLLADAGGDATIIGEYFYESTDVVCILHGFDQDIKTDACFISNQIVQCKVPSLKPGVYSLSIQDGYNQIASNDLQITVEENIVLEHLYPSSGPISGGTKVLIVGTAFDTGDKITCHFGTQQVSARVLSSSEVHCVAPRSLKGSESVLVVLSRNSIFVTRDPLQFHYTHMPEVHSLSPTYKVSVASTISLTGKHLHNPFSRTIVKLGDTEIEEVKTTLTDVLEFTVPKSLQSYDDALALRLSISTNDGVDFCLQDQTLSIASDTNIIGIHPKIGVVLGGSKVLVSVSNFMTNFGAKCRFGEEVVDADISSVNDFYCISPAAINPGLVRFDISVDGKVWSESGLVFEYVLPFSFSNIEPSRISTKGGSIMHIHGSNFFNHEDLKCAFGPELYTTATFLSATQIICLSPNSGGEVGLLPFNILVEGIKVGLETTQVEFMRLPSVTWQPYFGSLTGGTSIFFTLREYDHIFVGSEEVNCVFDIEGHRYTSKVDKLDEVQWTCKTPNVSKHTSSGTVKARLGILSNTTGYYHPSDSTFSFIETPEIIAFPMIGHEQGLTNITISASRGIFLKTPATKCKFGNTLVQAYWGSDPKFSCVAPPSSGDLQVTLEITQNGFDFIKVGIYSYEMAPNPVNVVPRFVSHSYQNMVSVQIEDGFHQFEAGQDIFCQHYIHSHETDITKGYWDDSNKLVVCPLSSFTSHDYEGSINIRLSLNGQEFSYGFERYHVIDDSKRVIGIKPEHGIQGQTTTVQMTGHFLDAEWSCSLEDTKVYPARVLLSSESEIHCEVKCPVRGHGTMELVLRSLDGTEFSRTPFDCDVFPKLTSIYPTVFVTDSRQKLIFHNEEVQFRRKQFTLQVWNEIEFYHVEGHLDEFGHVVCELPAIQHEGKLEVAICPNDQNCIHLDHIEIYTFPVPSVTQTPGVISPNEWFTVKGTFGQFWNRISCKLDGTQTISSAISHDTVSCFAPENIDGKINVSLDIELLGSSTSLLDETQKIVVEKRPTISYLSQQQSVFSQSNIIQIFGSNFRNSSVACHYGKFVLDGSFVSSNEILCPTPISRQKEKLSFRLRVGSSFAKKEFFFHLIDPWIIDDLIPASGSEAGGTTVSIVGENFVNGMSIVCRFGTVRVLAQVYSESLVKCTSPPQETLGFVVFQLEMPETGMVLTSATNPPKFFVFSDFIIEDYEPKIGNSIGGTEVVATGNWIEIEDDLEALSPTCKFGNHVVAATLVTSYALMCQTPTKILGAHDEFFSFAVSLNGIDYTEAPEDFKYTKEDHEIISMTPSSGSIEGGTKVSFHFNELKNTSNLYCRFGNTIEVEATHNPETDILSCFSPNVDKPALVPVYLRNSDKIWFHSGHFFDYRKPFSLLHLSPSVVKGGDLLSISGEGFLKKSKWYCRFDLEVVRAERISSKLLTCLVPTNLDESLMVSISSNLVDFYSVPGILQVMPETYIENIEPKSGPSNDKTFITVNGHGFSSDFHYICKFDGFSTVANFETESTLHCPSALLPFPRNGIRTSLFSLVDIFGNDINCFGDCDAFTFVALDVGAINLVPAAVSIDVDNVISIDCSSIAANLKAIEENIDSNAIKIQLGRSFEVEAAIQGTSIVFQIPLKISNELYDHQNTLVTCDISFNNGQNYQRGSELLLFENPSLINIEPNFLIQGIHRTVTLGLSKSVEVGSWTSVVCQIGNDFTKGILNIDHIECPLPDNADVVESTQVTASLNGRDFFSEVKIIYFRMKPNFDESIHYVSPLGGLVTLSGTKFNTFKDCDLTFICIDESYGDTHHCSEMIVESDSVLFFEAPPADGKWDLSVPITRQDSLNIGIHLEYLPDIHPSKACRILSSSGSLNDWHVVEIHVGNLISDFEYMCVFNAHVINPTPAQYHSGRGIITCKISNKENVSTVQVMRTVDNYISNKAHVFNPRNEIVAVDPNVVAVNIDTIMTLSGSFESESSMICRFHDSDGRLYKAPFHSHSKESISCSVPAIMPPGEAFVSVGNENYSFGNRMRFDIKQSFGNVSLLPRKAFAQGGTFVHFYLEQDTWSLDSDLYLFACNFFGSRVVGHVLSSKKIQCMVPHSKVIGDIPLSLELLSKKTQKYYLIHPSNFTFEYTESVEISSVQPLHISSSGATIVVKTNFLGNEIMGRLVSLTDDSYVEIDIIKKKDGEHTFEVPPILGGGYFYLELSNNGFDFTRYNDPLLVHTTSFEISSAGSTIISPDVKSTIKLKGTDFGHSKFEKLLFCQVDHLRGKVQWLSPFFLECDLSEMNLQPGTYKLSVVEVTHEQNNELFYSNSIPLKVEVANTVTSVYPLYGGNRGGTIVTIKGLALSTLHNATTCEFGSLNVGLQILNDTHASCEVPPAINIDPENLIQDNFGNRILFRLLSPTLSWEAYFLYHEDETTSGLLPSNLVYANVDYTLQIFGTGFHDTPELSCKLGSTFVNQAIFVSEKEVLCKVNTNELQKNDFSPQNRASQSFHTVTVSNNGQFDQRLDPFSNQMLMTYEEVQIESFEPSEGYQGSHVYISASNLPEIYKVICAFGATTSVGSWEKNNGIICNVPFINGETDVLLSISFNEVHYKNVGIFKIRQNPLAYSVEPAYVTVHGGVNVTILGTNFVHSAPMVCRFDERDVPAYVLSQESLSCPVPPQNIDGTIPLRVFRVTNNFEQNAQSNIPYIEFHYIKVMKLWKMTPRFGSFQGGTRIFIQGENFPSKSDTRLYDFVCIFGKEITTNATIEEGGISCLTPTIEHYNNVHKRSIFVSTGIKHSRGITKFTDSTLIFYLTRTPVIESIYPTSGISSGGEQVIIFGKNISRPYVENDLSCSFDNYIVSGTWIANDQIQCTTPALASITGTKGPSLLGEDVQSNSYEVKVSTNGVDFFGGKSPVAFTFHDDPLVLNVVPSHGTIQGSTNVKIVGIGFPVPSDDSSIYCLFGNKQAIGNYINSTLVECETPSFPLPSNVSVSLEYFRKLKGQGTTLETRALFEFLSNPVIERIEPMALSQPQFISKGFLDVYGLNFKASPDLTCKLEYNSNGDYPNESFAVDAIFIDETHIQCLFSNPGHELKTWQKSLALTVSSNAADWSDVFKVPVLLPHTLTKISPTLGPISGGTEVYLQGYNFIDSKALACRFGDIIVKAEFRSPEEIICTSPPQIDSDFSVLQVAVTNNGCDFTNNEVVFEYYNDVVITSISPDVGPSSGGTVIELSLNVEASSSFWCKFNETLVEAEISSSGESILCDSPTANTQGGSVPVSVTRNRVNYSRGDTYFFYLPFVNHHLWSISPTHGPRSGGTTITVTGFPITYGIIAPKCRFNDIVVDALMLKSSLDSIMCVSPATDMTGDPSTSFVLLDVSLTGNLDDFTSIGLVFRYDEDLSITAITPNTGSIKGNTLVHVTGGPFHQSYQDCLSCRFGEVISKAQWESESAISCNTPKLPSILPAQNISLFHVAWKQEIQKLQITAEDYRREVHTIITDGSKETVEEIQHVSISSSPKDLEVQRISLDFNAPDSVNIQVSFPLQNLAHRDKITFKFIFSGFAEKMEISNEISIHATEIDVIKTFNELDFVKTGSVRVTKSQVNDGDGHVMLSISFCPIIEHPIVYFDQDRVVEIQTSPSLRKGTELSYDISVAARDVQLLEYSTDHGIIYCENSNHQGSFSFHSSSSEDTVKHVIESVVESDMLFYGKVEVRKTLLRSKDVKLLIVFRETTARKPSLKCAPNVNIHILENGLYENSLSTTFQLNSGDHYSIPIPWNITAEDLQQTLEDLPSLSQQIMNVSMHSSFSHDQTSISWDVTFKHAKAIPFLQVSNITTSHGFKPSVVVERLPRARCDNIMYRININGKWSTLIRFDASKDEIQHAIQSIEGLYIDVDGLLVSEGNLDYDLHILQYIGEEPNGFIPPISGNIPDIVVNFQEVEKCRITKSVQTVQNGTEPIRSTNGKGFRLLPPEVEEIYPITQMSRWLAHNESAETFKNALFETGYFHSDLDVSREGPYRNGSYKWHVTYPFDQTSKGKTWTVVRTGGGAMKLSGDNANVSSYISQTGTEQVDGTFQLSLGTGNSTMTTHPIPSNTTSEDLKSSLEHLSSVGSVDVDTYHMTGSSNRVWLITFTSLVNIGDVPQLTPLSSLSGSNVDIIIEETIKGVGNTVLALEIPVDFSFRVVTSADSTKFLHILDGIHAIQKVLNELLGDAYVVEMYMSRVYILPLSLTSADFDQIGIEVYDECGGVSQKLCFREYMPFITISKNTISPLTGTFALTYNSSQSESCHIYPCIQQTSPIPVHATAAEVKKELESLILIDEVDVSVHNVKLFYPSHGSFGTTSTFEIKFVDVKGCRTNENARCGLISSPGKLSLEIDDSKLSGTRAYDFNLDREIYVSSSDYISGVHDTRGRTVPVQVSMNDLDFSPIQSYYTYRKDMTIEKLLPNHGVEGTRILVVGTHFVDSNSTQCLFLDESSGDSTVDFPIYINNTHVQCIAPARQHSFTMRLYMSFNKQIHSEMDFALFTYDNPVLIRDFYPKSGSTNGGYYLEIFGQGFQNKTDLSCKLGSLSSIAYFVSVEKILCKVPRHVEGLVDIFVSNNGQQYFTHHHPFLFYQDIDIVHLSPMSGPLIQAGNLVHIYGKNFLNLTSSVCSFGGHSVVSTFVSSREITCIVPALDTPNKATWKALSDYKQYGQLFNSAHTFPFYKSKLVDVTVSLNGRDFTTQTLKYLYQADIEIHSFSTTDVDIDGGTAIFVKGSNFVNSTLLTCKFGTRNAKASFISRNMVMCISPSMANIEQNEDSNLLSSFTEGSFALEISNNGVDFTKHQKSMTTRSSIDGFFQKGADKDTLLPCPAGTYCKDFNHQNFTLCPAGTFQSRTAQKLCQVCTEGFICPEMGLTTPSK